MLIVGERALDVERRDAAALVFWALLPWPLVDFASSSQRRPECVHRLQRQTVIRVGLQYHDDSYAARHRSMQGGNHVWNAVSNERDDEQVVPRRIHDLEQSLISPPRKG